MANAKRDENYITSILGVSNADGTTPVVVYADPSTHRLFTSSAADGSVFTDGEAFTLGTSQVMVAGAIRDDSLSTLSASEGDAVPLRVSSTGALHVTGGGGGTQYNVDDVAGGSDTGSLSLVIRDDALTTLTPADGDYTGLRVDSVGALWVNIGASSLEVSNNGTFAVQEDGGALTALELIDDVVVADDAAFTPGTTKVAMAGFEFDDSATDSVDEGDAGAARMSGNRNQYIQIRDGAGNERGANVDASNQLSVVDSAVKTAVEVMDDWDESDRAKVNIIAGQAGVTAGAGTVASNTPRMTLASNDPAVTALQIMDDWDNGASDGASVSGDVAHDSADAGEPVKLGGKAVTAPPSAVSANDRVNAQFDIYGRQVKIGALREMKGAQKTQISSSTSETTVVTADATYKLDVYGVIITNTSSTNTEVTFKDSTAGTTRFIISAPANDTRGFMLPIDSGHNQNAANNNWTATCADSVAAIEITMMFVKNL